MPNPVQQQQLSLLKSFNRRCQNIDPATIIVERARYYAARSLVPVRDAMREAAKAAETVGAFDYADRIRALADEPL